MNLNLTWSRRWRLRETTSPRHRRHRRVDEFSTQAPKPVPSSACDFAKRYGCAQDECAKAAAAKAACVEKLERDAERAAARARDAAPKGSGPMPPANASWVLSAPRR